MKIHMAGLDVHKSILLSDEKGVDFGLVSFFYIKNNSKLNEVLSKINKKLLIDSGAFSFMHGQTSDFEDYTKKYRDFIKSNTNNPKIEGFFEMDIDSVVGYEKVLEYRKQLEEVSDKIIPVWHSNRGIDDYIEMCKKYKGKKISISTLHGDVDKSQYNLFINTAHKYGCKIHLLGCTDFNIIKNVNLGIDDSADSTSWCMSGAFNTLCLPNKNGTIALIPLLRLNGIGSSQIDVINYYSYKEIMKYYEHLDFSVIKEGER